jgi:hypothetical protein
MNKQSKKTKAGKVKKYTERGFRNYTAFKDTYANDVVVRESSSMLPRVWIFCSKDGEDGRMHLGAWQGHSPHLSVTQAKRVIAALQKFVDDYAPKRKAQKHV